MGIIIGDKNKIKNSNIIENATIKLEKQKKEGFWKPIFVNLVSNILWKILGIVVAFGILAWISNALTTTH